MAVLLVSPQIPRDLLRKRKQLPPFESAGQSHLKGQHEALQGNDGVIVCGVPLLAIQMKLLAISETDYISLGRRPPLSFTNVIVEDEGACSAPSGFTIQFISILPSFRYSITEKGARAPFSASLPEHFPYLSLFLTGFSCFLSGLAAGLAPQPHPHCPAIVSLLSFCCLICLYYTPFYLTLVSSDLIYSMCTTYSEYLMTRRFSRTFVT